MSEKISQKGTEFVLGNTYFRQTFTECVPNQYTYDILTIDVWIVIFSQNFHKLCLLGNQKPDVTACYGRLSVFASEFLNIMTCSNFNKLRVKAEE